MKVILIFLLLTIQGCFWQNADITDIKKGEQFCKDRGGIKYISIGAIRNDIVVCVSGARSHIYKIKLQEYESK